MLNVLDGSGKHLLGQEGPDVMHILPFAFDAMLLDK